MLILLRLWIIGSTILVSAGWLLSLINELNPAGYATVIGVTAIVFVWWGRQRVESGWMAFLRELHKICRRCRRAAPMLFGVLAVLTFISGCIYPALNWDANAYRLPRIYHWLAAGHWHWIEADDSRLNISACGQEWLLAPFAALTHSDRGMFLINWVSFLCMPGLLFSVLARLKVRAKVAWWWMWFLAAGYCYVTQAASVANDSFAAVYALAAVDFALRAREKNSISDLWLSGLAVALLTGAKQINVPLGLLWLLAVWPARQLLSRQVVASLAIGLVACLVSVIPISIINYYHYGSWMPSETVTLKGSFHLNPFWGVVGNLVALPVQNLLPPFAEFIPPFYGYLIPFWNGLVAGFNNTPFGAHFASFERFGYLSASTYGGIGEGNAGIGLGVCVLLAAMFYAGKTKPAETRPGRTALWLRMKNPLIIAPWFLLLVFMAKVGTFENARHLAAYYPFFFPLLIGGSRAINAAKQKQWQMLGLGTMVVAVLLIITQATRPLFPAQTLFAFLKHKYEHSDWVDEQCYKYNVSPFRNIELRRVWLAQNLPPTEPVIGYVGNSYDVDEPGIWMAGKHRVKWISPDEPYSKIKQSEIHYAIVTVHGWEQTSTTLEAFLKKNNATVISTCKYIPSDKLPVPKLYETHQWICLVHFN